VSTGRNFDRCNGPKMQRKGPDRVDAPGPLADGAGSRCDFRNGESRGVVRHLGGKPTHVLALFLFQVQSHALINISSLRRITWDWRRGWDSNPRAGYPTTRFRGAPVTTTSVPLRLSICTGAHAQVKPAPFGRYRRGSGRPLTRRASKNSCITARHASSSTPPTASIRWFSDGCSCARIADSIAPAFGSRAP
jgi:hypothetical protein